MALTRMATAAVSRSALPSVACIFLGRFGLQGSGWRTPWTRRCPWTSRTRFTSPPCGAWCRVCSATPGGVNISCRMRQYPLPKKIPGDLLKMDYWGLIFLMNSLKLKVQVSSALGCTKSHKSTPMPTIKKSLGAYPSCGM